MLAFRHISIPLFILFGLSACSSAYQDTGSGTAISGTAVNSYLIGTTVYQDIDNDGRLDYFEPVAITDDLGYFSTASDGSNYCSAADTQHHCLGVGIDYTGTILRVYGGYDSYLSYDFVGSMSRAIDGTTNQIVSPLSSMIAQLDATEAATFISQEDALVSNDTVALSDYLSDPLTLADATSGSSEKETFLIHRSLFIHKAVTVLAAELKRIYPQRTDSAGEVVDIKEASHYIYKAMMDTWAATPQEIGTLLADSTQLAAIMTAAKASVAADQGILASGYTEASDLSSRISQLSSLSSSLFATSGLMEDSTQHQIKARARALEVVAIMLRKALPSNVDTAVSTSSGSTYLTNLEDSGVDVAYLARAFEAGETPSGDFSARQTLIEAGLIVDTAKFLSEVGSNNTTTVTLFSDETVTLDVSHSDYSEDTDGDGQAEAIPLTGTWSELDTYTVIMDIETAGSTRTIILRTNPEGTGFQMDLGDEISDWI